MKFGFIFSFPNHHLSFVIKAALLLKSQVQAVQQEIFEKDTDTDVAELIGQAVNLEKYVEVVKHIE